jgi:hypothetical protein
MSKIGNEARLIQKVVEERVDKKLNESLNYTDRSYARGVQEGLRFVMDAFRSVSNELERN